MTLYNQMVAEIGQQRGTEGCNVEQEVMQRIALARLFRGGFFKHAAFYGGTCLRIFHELPRFSEDMDFTLTEKNPEIHAELLQLNREANTLMDEIQKAWEKLK